MVNWQTRSKRKPTGGKLKQFAEKHKRELGREETRPQLGEEKKKKIRSRGNNEKIRMMLCEYANVTDQKSGKTKKVKILDVEENPANIDFSRRKIITRGAIINTEAGKARVTSRPGQAGIVNAILIKS
ncbi:MAG: 30S ribosomal protein S8e [Candidatus Jordarchaeaceae archaeon]